LPCSQGCELPYRRALSVLLLTPHFPALPPSLSHLPRPSPSPCCCSLALLTRQVTLCRSHSTGCVRSGTSVRLALCRSTLQTQTGAAQFGLSRDCDFFGPRRAPRSFVTTRSHPQPASSGLHQNLSCDRIHRNITGSPVLICSNTRHSTPAPADVR
jgi:hypothetical protein